MNWKLALVLLGMAVALVYAASCWWWPFAKCGRCGGKGKRERADGKVWRDCKRCKASGRRLRVGRKLWNYLHEQKKAAR